MPTIAVLIADGFARDVVSRQLGGVGPIELHDRAHGLVERAANAHLDAVVMELDDESGRSVAPTLVELTACRPLLPVVLYARVNAASIPKLMAVLTTGMRIECAVRPYEPVEPVLRRVLSPDYRPGAAAPLLQSLVPGVPAVLRTFVTLAVLGAPCRRSVDEVSRWSGVTARTVERRLHRAHWAPAHVVLQSFSALDAVWLMSEYGWSARRVQQVRGFPHASSVTRLLSRYAGTRPSTLREDGGFPAALAHVTEALVRGLER